MYVYMYVCMYVCICIYNHVKEKWKKRLVDDAVYT